MATSKTEQLTDFTQDVLGRYICNGFDEAMDSMDNNSPRPHVQSDARLFNVLIIGGFDGVLARHLLYADKTNSYRSISRILPCSGNLHRDAGIGLGNAARDWPAAAVTALKQKHSCLE